MKKNILKIGLIQMLVTADKDKNIEVAQAGILEVSSADIIVLPEIWNSPYSAKCFSQYAEISGEKSHKMLSQMAASLGKYIVGGSIPERDGEKIYNTCYVFSPTGEQIAKHRKMHLFDINVEGGQKFQESAILSAGNEVTVFDTDFGTCGVCICFDYRFAELARLMTQEGARLIFVPAAFNMTTGPLHWEVMFRGRSVDNQVFSIGCAPARDEHGGYVSYAHSIVTSPWGRIVAQLDASPKSQIVKIELDEVDKVRAQLPILQHRRLDLYSTSKV